MKNIARFITGFNTLGYGMAALCDAGGVIKASDNTMRKNKFKSMVKNAAVAAINGVIYIALED